MEKNILITAIAVLGLGVAGFVYLRSAPSSEEVMIEKPEVIVDEEMVEVEEAVVETSDIKEFSMDSYYDDKGIWFSVKEINVNKGDLVRINVTNTKGMHDFMIDDYGISMETPLNEVTTIEFVADKAGEFVYYCSKPNHREKGQWGTLKVSE